MAPTIISKKASNWVDRGEPPTLTVERVLSRFLDLNPADRHDWFREQANIITAMVDADATEVHLAGFLQSLLEESGRPAAEYGLCRLTAIALWHIAKAALVRDFAERVLRGDVPVNEPTPDTLGHWIAERLLTADELARFEDEARHTDRTDRTE